jgi:hypothetical protein
MKIFISSLIGGFESIRAAARSAIETLNHDPIMAEDFVAQPNSPQIACLQGVRKADLVVLILGERYGNVEGSSGKSPTHEEYLEARGKKPILIFTQAGVSRDLKQAAFASEVEGWEGGFFREPFTDASDLQTHVIRAIHQHELAHASAPLDLKLLEKNARDLVQQSHRNSPNSPFLKLAIVGGPIQQILRPIEMENDSFAEELNKQALFGDYRLFKTSSGVDTGIDDADLFLEQKDGARIQLSEQGTLQFRQPLEKLTERERPGFGGLPMLIEETVIDQLNAVIAYASWVLERIDSTQRLSHVGIAALIEGADYTGWRTQAEHDASPNAARIMYGGREPKPIVLSTPRAALRFRRAQLAEDLMVSLRRQRKDR